MNDIIKEITSIKEEIKPLEEKIRELYLKIDLIRKEENKELFKPIIERIRKGDKVGKKSHWSSPFYNFHSSEWKKYNWNSEEEFIMSQSVPDWFTFDENEIEDLT